MVVFGGLLNNRTMIPRLHSLSRKLMKEKFHQFLNYPSILLYNFYDLVVFEFIRLFLFVFSIKFMKARFEF